MDRFIADTKFLKGDGFVNLKSQELNQMIIDGLLYKSIHIGF